MKDSIGKIIYEVKKINKNKKSIGKSIKIDDFIRPMRISSTKHDGSLKE